MSTFADLGLSQPLIETISGLGFEKPTPIQSKAIPILLDEDTDLVGLAETGTGKTAAFGLPLLERVDTNERYVQALVIAPTRELCLQITKEFKLFSKHMRKLSILAVYGGSDIGGQMRAIRKGVHIIVATPGRLRDLIRRKAVDISKIDFVILDEADEMLNMGFKEEIDDILENTSDEKLTWLFSATMPSEVRRISRNYMNKPQEVSVRGQNVANVDIDHQYVVVYPSARYEALKRFLDTDRTTFGLIFCRTRRDTKEVADFLGKDGYNADALHGDLNQTQRDRVMAKFRNRQLQVLVATDVAARGIDVQDITHVFHFNIPDDLSYYTHRSGRTGRAGKKGISLVFAHPNDVNMLRRLERTVKIKFKETLIPTGKEICERQVLHYIHQIKESIPSKELDDFLPKISEELEEFSKEEIIAKVAAISFNHFLEKYRYAPDLNRGKRKERRDPSQKMQRLFINIGMIDVDNKGQLLGMICRETGISGHTVGRIDMKRTYTHFDVEQGLGEQVISAFKDFNIDGREVRVNEAEQRPSKHRKGGKGKFKKKKKWKKEW